MFEGCIVCNNLGLVKLIFVQVEEKSCPVGTARSVRENGVVLLVVDIGTKSWYLVMVRCAAGLITFKFLLFFVFLSDTIVFELNGLIITVA